MYKETRGEGGGDVQRDNGEKEGGDRDTGRCTKKQGGRGVGEGGTETQRDVQRDNGEKEGGDRDTGRCTKRHGRKEREGTETQGDVQRDKGKRGEQKHRGMYKETKGGRRRGQRYRVMYKETKNKGGNG